MIIGVVDWQAIRFLLYSDYGIAAAFIGFVLVVAGKLYRHNLAGFLGCILIFTAFDLLGYKYAIEAAGRAGLALMAYRIMQFLFQFILIVLFLPSSRNVAIGFTLVWWTGGCDILYYLIGNYPFSETMSWLSWTFPGLVITAANQLMGTKFVINTVFICIVSGSVFLFYVYWFMLNDIKRFSYGSEPLVRKKTGVEEAKKKDSRWI